MAIFPGAVSTDSNLYIAVNNLSTTLTDNPLLIGATTVNVTTTTGFPSVGFISIDSEIISYTATTMTSFTGCTRGVEGSVAASHLINSQVFHNVVAAHHNVLKDEVKAIETYLINIGTSVRSLVTVGASIPAAASNVMKNITTISLGAGTWDITGIVVFNQAGATITRCLGYVSQYSDDLRTDEQQGDNEVDSPIPTSSNSEAVIPSWRITLVAPATVYLKGQANYSAGTPQISGRISAVLMGN